MSRTTVQSILARVTTDEEPRFIPTRYPYTYAADMLRQCPQIVPDELIGPDPQSRSEASQIRQRWAEMEDREDEDLAYTLANAYLILNGISLPQSQEETEA